MEKINKTRSVEEMQFRNC